jgi:hypothetical protein
MPSGPRRGDRLRHPGRLISSVTALLALALNLLQPAPAHAQAPTLLRYPYLTDLGSIFATVNFASDTDSPHPTVTWGPAPGGCSQGVAPTTANAITVNGVREYQFRAQLTGLAPNTQYCYRVVQAGVDLLGSDASPVFASGVAAGAPDGFSFAVLGDWGYNGVTSSGTNPDQALVLSQIAGSGARFVVSTGDNAYQSGSQTDYGDLVQTGPNVSSVFGAQYWKNVGATMPAFMPMGNHGMTQANAYFANWSEAQTALSSGGRYQIDNYCCVDGTNPGNYPSAWYAFDYGAARFYVLEAAWPNSNVGTGSLYQDDYDGHWAPGSPEVSWLTADMLAHTGVTKFAFFHFPLYSDSNSETSDSFLQGGNSLEGLLAANNVRVVFNGHAHFYERNNSAYPGMTTYVTGGGGGAPERVGPCSAYDAYAVGWGSNGGSSCNAPRPTSASQVFHFLLVTVANGSVTVTPTDETGRTFDVQTYPY